MVTVLVAIWFLRMGDEATEEIEGLVNQSIAQNEIINEATAETSELVENNNTGTIFENLEYNFSFTLFDNESVKEESSALIYTVYFNSDKLSVMDEDMESAVKDAISIQSEKEVNVNGVTGTEIVATSNKDGSETYLILIKKDGKLFHFQGTDTFLTKIKTQFFFEN